MTISINFFDGFHYFWWISSFSMDFDIFLIKSTGFWTIRLNPDLIQIHIKNLIDIQFNYKRSWCFSPGQFNCLSLNWGVTNRIVNCGFKNCIKIENFRWAKWMLQGEGRSKNWIPRKSNDRRKRNGRQNSSPIDRHSKLETTTTSHKSLGIIHQWSRAILYPRYATLNWHSSLGYIGLALKT